MSNAEDEYTPTTEQVRDVYHLGLLNAGPSVDVEAALAQFDRWLGGHDAEVCATVLTTVLSKVAELSPAAREPLRGYISVLEDSVKDLLPDERNDNLSEKIREFIRAYGKGEK